jgi:hypothetical protein
VTEVAALRNVVSPAPRAIWQAVDDLTTHARYLRLNIRPNPRAADVWRAAMPAGAHRVDRMAHAIDLDGGFDAVWHGRL